jgi:ribosomal protein L7/L12
MPGAFDTQDLQRHFTQINSRLREIEAQIAKLSEKAGIDYVAPAAEAPEEVVNLVESGDTMGAIKKYRELTGADGATAREVVSGL